MKDIEESISEGEIEEVVEEIAKEVDDEIAEAALRRFALRVVPALLALAGFYLFVPATLSKPVVRFEGSASLETWGKSRFLLVGDESLVLCHAERPHSRLLVYEAATGKKLLEQGGWTPIGLYADRYLLLERNRSKQLTNAILDLENRTLLAVNGGDPGHLLVQPEWMRIQETDGLEGCVERFYFHHDRYFVQVERPRIGDATRTLSVHSVVDARELVSFPYEKHIPVRPDELESRRDRTEFRTDGRVVIHVDGEEGEITLPLSDRRISEDFGYRKYDAPSREPSVPLESFVPLEEVEQGAPDPAAREYVTGHYLVATTRDGELVLGYAVLDGECDGLFSRDQVRTAKWIGMVRYYLLLGLAILFVLVVVLNHSDRVTVHETITDQEGRVIGYSQQTYE